MERWLDLKEGVDSHVDLLGRSSANLDCPQATVSATVTRDYGSELPVSVRHFHKIGRAVTAGIIDAKYTLLECSNQLTVGESEAADVVTSSFEEAASISDCTKQDGAISGLHWHMASSLMKATSLDDAVGAVD